MCKCTPEIKTPFCGKSETCKWPSETPEGIREDAAPQADAPVTPIGDEPADKDFAPGANKMLSKTATFKSK